MFLRSDAGLSLACRIPKQNTIYCSRRSSKWISWREGLYLLARNFPHLTMIFRKALNIPTEMHVGSSLSGVLSPDPWVTSPCSRIAKIFEYGAINQARRQDAAMGTMYNDWIIPRGFWYSSTREKTQETHLWSDNHPSLRACIQQ